MLDDDYALLYVAAAAAARRRPGVDSDPAGREQGPLNICTYFLPTQLTLTDQKRNLRYPVVKR